MFPTNFFPYLKFEMQLFGYASEGQDGEQCQERDRGWMCPLSWLKHLLLLGLIKELGGSSDESRIAYLFERHSATP